MNRNAVPTDQSKVHPGVTFTAAEPALPKSALKIRAFRDVIAQYLPAFGLADARPTDQDAGGTESSALIASWYAHGAGQLARVVEIAGRGSVTTWPSHDLPHVDIGQPLPCYCDVHEIDATADYVYVTSTGLPSHPIGPWQNTDGVLGAWPTKKRRIFRFPKQPWLADTGVVTPAGDVGVWINGIAIDGILDGWRFNPEQGIDIIDRSDQPYRNLWLRHINVDATTFVDPANGRPSETGEYRYYANPLALRSQLRDNVVYLPRADCYREDTAKLRHSPILGWTFEGLPIYGPYGYSDPLVPTTPIRRMVSGFVVRDGRNNTIDLGRRGRRSLPRWAAALRGVGEQLRPQQFGPDVSNTFELGRYVEDYDYLGDLGFEQGKDFDLDQCNGRFCVTPDFPDGTFAYFISLDADGTPAFPFVVGPRSYGVRDGGAVDNVPAEAKAVILAGCKASVKLQIRNVGSQQLLTWTSIEGGHYRVQGSVDGRDWVELASDVHSQGLTTGYTVDVTSGHRHYRNFSAQLISIDPHDE